MNEISNSNRIKRISKIVGGIMIVSTLSTPFAFAGETKISQDTQTSFPKTEIVSMETAKATVDSLVAKYGEQSVQYALIKDGKILLSGHAGAYSKTENKSLTTDTMYGIGSVSKIFLTLSVMKLVEQGKISLDSPVTTYIPEFKMKDERYKKITVRMLLNHSSGLMGSSLRNAFLFDDQDTFAHDNLLATLENQNLKADPGAYSVYCNDGFTLAEIAVERVSGITFTQFIEKYISTPLDLKNTKTSNDIFDKNKLAKTYASGIVNALPKDSVSIIGAGGIYSTAEDMCKFAQIFMNNQDTSKGVISPSTARLTGAPEYKKGIWADGPSDSIGYGLGWDNVNEIDFGGYTSQALMKGGDSLAYHSSIVVLPKENMAVAVLSSGGSSSVNNLACQALLKAALTEDGKLPKVKNETLKVTLSTPKSGIPIPSDILKHQGYYANTYSIMKIVMTADGRLDITVPSVPYYAEHFLYQGDGIFTDDKNTSKVSFVKEKNGETYIKVETTAFLPGLGQVNDTLYTSQKIEDNPISPAIADAWAQRDGKTYYVINEKYTSQTYFLSEPATKVTVSKEPVGYVLSAKITTANTARAFLKIPAVYGRDLGEYEFYQENGTEYLTNGSTKAISEDGIKTLYNGKSSKCTIPSDGCSVWYKIGKSAGKTMTVSLPKKGSFAVYDKNHSCVNASLASGINTIQLPANGTIVFAGNPGQIFNITIN